MEEKEYNAALEEEVSSFEHNCPHPMERGGVGDEGVVLTGKGGRQ